VLPLAQVELYSGKTAPPDHLSEAELIGLMEKHGIGTDASIPTHINNICERNYVQVRRRRCTHSGARAELPPDVRFGSRV
jgi:DNA topoisomerase III